MSTRIFLNFKNNFIRQKLRPVSLRIGRGRTIKRKFRVTPVIVPPRQQRTRGMELKVFSSVTSESFPTAAQLIPAQAANTACLRYRPPARRSVGGIATGTGVAAARLSGHHQGEADCRFPVPAGVAVEQEGGNRSVLYPDRAPGIGQARHHQINEKRECSTLTTKEADFSATFTIMAMTSTKKVFDFTFM